MRKKALYLIEILHQTTTSRLNGRTLIRCILSKFYIKPQHDRYAEYSACCCILSKFYIKPQQCPSSMAFPAVVSYRNSTSNHNKAPTFAKRIGVVSYRNSTSNHNLPHARVCSIGLYLIEILHQTTTNSAARLSFPRCILSKFYIKPQHRFNHWRSRSGCILSKFYIKPQPSARVRELLKGCILSKFYIKPQLKRLQPVCLIGCILSKFYIKPQLVEIIHSQKKVVSYRNSTSNHNST